MKNLLTQTAMDALCTALARSRGMRGYDQQDCLNLFDWANDIVRKADQLHEIVQGLRGLKMEGDGISTYPLAVSKEKRGSRKKLVGDLCNPTPELPQVKVARAEPVKGITGNQKSNLTLAGGQYKMLAKPGSLYDTLLRVLDKKCSLAEAPSLFEAYRAKQITADDLAIKVMVNFDRLCDYIETNAEYAKYMERIKQLASGGSIRAARMSGRSVRERLQEAAYLLAESSAYSSAQPRNAWRLRKAGLVFLKGSIKAPRNVFVSLFPAQYEGTFWQMMGEIGAEVSHQKTSVQTDAKLFLASQSSK